MFLPSYPISIFTRGHSELGKNGQKKHIENRICNLYDTQTMAILQGDFFENPYTSLTAITEIVENILFESLIIKDNFQSV